MLALAPAPSSVDDPDLFTALHCPTAALLQHQNHYYYNSQNTYNYNNNNQNSDYSTSSPNLSTFPTLYHSAYQPLLPVLAASVNFSRPSSASSHTSPMLHPTPSTSSPSPSPSSLPSPRPPSPPPPQPPTVLATPTSTPLAPSPRPDHFSKPLDYSVGVVGGLGAGVGVELSEVGLLDEHLRTPKDPPPAASFFPHRSPTSSASAVAATAAPFGEYDLYFGDFLGDDTVPPPHALPVLEDQSGITDEEMNVSVCTAPAGGVALGVRRAAIANKKRSATHQPYQQLNNFNNSQPRLLADPNSRSKDMFTFSTIPASSQLLPHTQTETNNNLQQQQVQQQQLALQMQIQMQSLQGQHQLEPVLSQNNTITSFNVASSYNVVEPQIHRTQTQQQSIKPDAALFECDDLSLSGASERDSQSEADVVETVGDIDGDGDGDDERTLLDSPVSGSCASGSTPPTHRHGHSLSTGGGGSANRDKVSDTLTHPDQYENLDPLTRAYVDALREKIKLMPRRKLREYLARNVTLDDVVPLMAVNRDELAGMLGLGVTTWKTFMHSIGVSRWPARALKSHRVKHKKMTERMEEARKMNEMDVVAKLERDLQKLRGARGRMMKGIRGKVHRAGTGQQDHQGHGQ